MTQEEITSMLKATFGTPQGQKCLSYLEDVFVSRPVYKAGSTFDEVAFREGQRDMVMQIKKEVTNG